MKSVVIYYSLTGKSKAVAEGFAQELGCEVRQVEEIKRRSFAGAYFFGAFAALKGRTSEIKPLDIDMSAYDTIVIATPVWASSPVPAINAFVAGTDFQDKKAVLLVSPAGGDYAKAAARLSDMIQAKGGTVLKHHGFKTGGAKENDLRAKAVETAKLYK